MPFQGASALARHGTLNCQRAKRDEVGANRRGQSEGAIRSDGSSKRTADTVLSVAHGLVAMRFAAAVTVLPVTSKLAAKPGVEPVLRPETGSEPERSQLPARK